MENKKEQLVDSLIKKLENPRDWIFDIKLDSSPHATHIHDRIAICYGTVKEKVDDEKMKMAYLLNPDLTFNQELTDKLYDAIIKACDEYHYSVPHDTYNLLGKEISIVIDDEAPRKVHIFKWDGGGGKGEVLYCSTKSRKQLIFDLIHEYYPETEIVVVDNDTNPFGYVYKFCPDHDAGGDYYHYQLRIKDNKVTWVYPESKIWMSDINKSNLASLIESLNKKLAEEYLP